MPLINCPECSISISDKATSCPHCGYPINTMYLRVTSYLNANASKLQRSFIVLFSSILIILILKFTYKKYMIHHLTSEITRLEEEVYLSEKDDEKFSSPIMRMVGNENPQKREKILVLKARLRIINN